MVARPVVALSMTTVLSRTIIAPPGGALTGTVLLLLLLLLVCGLPDLLAAGRRPSSSPHPPCTIPRISAAELTAQEFLATRRHHQPLLLSGLTADWRAKDRWTWDFLLDENASAASTAVNVGTGASLAASGLASARPSLSSFVQQSVLQPDEAGNPDYIFDGAFFAGRRSALRADYHVPLDYFPFQVHQDNVTFFAGRAGSGLGFHKHGEAINVLVLGRKQWLIYRPESLSLAMGMDPGLSGAQWLEQIYPTLPAEARPEFECVQEAGEILYLPALFHHATVNLEDSLGLATRQASGGRVNSDAVSVNSLADGIETAAARSKQLCGGGDRGCGEAQAQLAALLMEAGRAAEALPLLEAAIAAVAPSPHLALMLHSELLLRRGKWYSPVRGAASVLRTYDSAVAAASEAEAAAEAEGAKEDSEASGALAVGGERHIFTGPSTWRDAALRQLCQVGSSTMLKHCYQLTMGALLAEPPRYKLATQAGRWALASAAESGSEVAVVMADDEYHTHGIQL